MKFKTKYLGHPQMVEEISSSIAIMSENNWTLISTYTTKILGDDALFGIFKNTI